MTVGEILTRIDDFDEETTIYAEQPFTVMSTALVAFEPDHEPYDLPLEGALLPAEAKAEGLAYLIEVFIAKDVIEVLRISTDGEPGADLKLRAVLHYKEYDAYM